MDAKIWVLLAFSTVVSSRDLFVGSNNSGHKIYDENRKANPAIWRQSENVTIVAGDGEIISKLAITDLRDEKDGDVKIVEGGQGQRNVTVELKSPTVLRGYEFHIEGYAVSDHEQTNGLENGEPQKALKDETKLNTTPKILVTPQTLLSTSENPLGSSTIGETNVKRQTRDAENRDKSSQESNRPLGVISSTTKASHLKSTISPIATLNREEEEKKSPSIYGFARHGNINQPGVHLREVSNISESTMRNIPKIEIKEIDTEQHHQEDPSNKNNVNRHTNIDYPKFSSGEVNTAAPVTNQEFTIAEDDSKNKNLHKRDVGEIPHNPIINIKENAGRFNNEDITHISEMMKSDQKQSALQGTSLTNTRTLDLRNDGNVQNLGHTDEEAKQLAEGQNHQNVFRGRHISRRFGFNQGSGSSKSSTETSKTSTLLPANAESKIINSQINKSLQYNTMNSPKVPTNEITTIKSESAGTHKPEADNTDKTYEPESAKEIIRTKRDTIVNKNDKETSKPIVENISVSTSTVQPNINQNTAVNINNTDSPSNTKIPFEIPFPKDNDKKDNLKTMSEETKNNERNTRDTIVNPKNDNNKPLSLLDSSTTTKPEEKDGQVENKSFREAQIIAQQPIELESKAKAVMANTTDEKERISRDTKAVKVSNKNENEQVSSSTEVPKKSITEKETQKPGEKVENKSVPVMLRGNNNYQRQGPVTIASVSESTSHLQGDSRVVASSSSHDVTNASIQDQVPKFLREARKSDLEETKVYIDGTSENTPLRSDSYSSKDKSNMAHPEIGSIRDVKKDKDAENTKLADKSATTK